MTDPIPVPDQHFEARRHHNDGRPIRKDVLGPPPGRSHDVGSIERIVETLEDGSLAMRFYFGLDDDDRARIAAGAPIELTIFGPNTFPFNVQIWDPALDTLEPSEPEPER